MDGFKEKYSLLVKYMLPSLHKCIEDVEFDGFVSGQESLVSNTDPKNEFERKMNNQLSTYITPKIKIRLKDSCNKMSGADKMGLKGDVFGKLTEIHSTFFEDRKLNANIRYIDIVPYNS